MVSQSGKDAPIDNLKSKAIEVNCDDGASVVPGNVHYCEGVEEGGRLLVLKV